MGKYAEDAKELLRHVGGRENIAAVSHCERNNKNYLKTEDQK